MIEAGAAGRRQASGFQRGPILVLAASAAVLFGAGLLWRDELRAVSPWYFGLAMLALLALTAAFGRWRLGLPWQHVGQTMVAALTVAIAVLAWIYADLVRDLEGPAAVVAFAVTMVGASTVILPAPTALTVIALASSLDNPIAVGVAAAAGLKTLEILRREGAYERIFATGNTLRSELQRMLNEAEIPASVVGEAPLFDVFFTDGEITDYRSTLTADKQMLNRFNELLLARGVLKGDTKFYISLAHSNADVQHTLDAFASAIDELKG